MAENGNNRIQKFDSNGNFITKWGTFGDGDGQFVTPEGIAIDSLNNVYVAERNDSSIIQDKLRLIPKQVMSMLGILIKIVVLKYLIHIRICE